MLDLFQVQREDKMSTTISTTLRQRYTWTLRGKNRVAMAIKATIQYNRESNLEPSSHRALARLAGFVDEDGNEKHTSILKYSKGHVDDPNRNNCFVLKAIAPYIYVVKEFYVRSDNYEITRAEHLTPDPRNPAPYWEQGVTYAGRWKDLVLMGEASSDYMEIIADDPDEEVYKKNELSRLLDSIINDRPSDAYLISASQSLGIPVSQLVKMRDRLPAAPTQGVEVLTEQFAQFTNVVGRLVDRLDRVTPSPAPVLPTLLPAMSQSTVEFTPLLRKFIPQLRKLGMSADHLAGMIDRKYNPTDRDLRMISEVSRIPIEQLKRVSSKLDKSRFQSVGEVIRHFIEVMGWDLERLGSECDPEGFAGMTAQRLDAIASGSVANAEELTRLEAVMSRNDFSWTFEELSILQTTGRYIPPELFPAPQEQDEEDREENGSYSHHS